MARKTQNEVAAGIFVVLGLLTTLGVVLWLGSAKFFQRTQGRAYFYRPHSAGPTGLRGGSIVQVGDLKVGQIDYLFDQADRGRTVYVVNLFPEAPAIYANGQANVPATLIGDATLSVTYVGDPNAGPTTEDKPMPIGGGLQAIADQVNKATAELAEASEKINRQLDPNRPDSVMAKVQVILDGAAKITADIILVAARLRSETDANQASSLLSQVVASATKLREMIFENKPKIDATVDDFAKTAAKVRQYTDEDVGKLLARLHEISDEVLASLRNLEEVTKTVRSLVDRNGPGIDAMVQNFVLVSANLKATAEEVRRAPWRLLHQPDQKELNSQNILDAARAFSTGAAQLDQAVTRMKTIDPRTASPEELQKVRDQLQQVFEKFSKAEQALFRELGKS